MNGFQRDAGAQEQDAGRQESRIASLESQLAAAEGEVEQNRGALGRRTNTINALRSEVEALKAKLAKATERPAILAMTDEWKAMEQKVKALQRKLDATELTELAGSYTCKRLEKEIEALKDTREDNTRAAWVRESARLTAENGKLRAWKEDYIDGMRRVMAEECAPDEKHCTCVPHLRDIIRDRTRDVEALTVRNEKLRGALQDIDALVLEMDEFDIDDAQRALSAIHQLSALTPADEPPESEPDGGGEQCPECGAGIVRVCSDCGWDADEALSASEQPEEGDDA